jgi:uncharacterized Zn-binding protein involved in type VI secretion
MQNMILVGYRNAGGGTAFTNSTSTLFGGIGVASKTSPVCSLIQGLVRWPLAERHLTFRDYNVPAAFDVHRCKCGRRLISWRPEAGAK